MNNIYVENYNLPESCWKCECLKDGDETGFYCSLSAFDNDEDYREVDVRHPKCPLKLLSTRLAEERMNLVKEIRQDLANKLTYNINDLENIMVICNKINSVLDKFERGE